MLPLGPSALGVAVSGGADSVFLFAVMRELAAELQLSLSAIHVNHRMRGEASDADARFVASLAESFAVPLHMRELGEGALEGNFEQAARRARNSFFRELIAAGDVNRVATGHTRNDQAETVLYRIFRGSGLAGLAGVLPVTSDGLIRPLLGITRQEVETWLTERGIPWREDATNRDTSFARNRLRHEVLPELRRQFNPQIDEALANLAELARDEEEYWRELVRVPEPTRGAVVLPLQDLAGVPVALARRRVRAAIAAVKGDPRRLEFPHIERILEMVRSREGSDRVQLPGLDVFRSFDWVRLAPAGYDNRLIRDFEVPVLIPGSGALPNGSYISFEVRLGAEPLEDCARVKVDLDWAKVYGLQELGECFTLRNWRPGDAYRPLGHTTEQKLKSLFQRCRIPLWERRNWPVLVANDKILWAREFGPAVAFAASASSSRTVAVTLSDVR